MTMHFSSLSTTPTDAPVAMSRAYRIVPGAPKIYFERGTARILKGAELAAALAHSQAVAETERVLARVRKLATAAEPTVQAVPVVPVRSPAVSRPAAAVPTGLPTWLCQPLVLPADWQTALGEAATPLKSREVKRFGLYRLNALRPKRYLEASMTDIDSAKRRRDYVWPRQRLIWLVKVLTDRSLPEIGRMFGGRDHTTALHAIRKVEGLRAQDPVLRAQLDAIAAEFVGLHLLREDRLRQEREAQASTTERAVAELPTAGASIH